MADHTKIEWTDATWNPITGCSVISPGCTNCYAMKLAGTRLRHHPSRAGLTSDSKAGPVWNGQVRLNEDWLTQPLKWSRPRHIFVCAHGDLFHDAVPDAWIDKIFAIMALAPQHTFQVLTKRPERMLAFVSVSTRQSRIAARAFFMDGEWSNAWPLPNVLLGVSVEDQPRADERRGYLGPLARRYGWRTFVSYEPALGPVDWIGWEFLSWMISGGESGKGARPSHPDWHRTARAFCAANGIPYMFKQWGEWLAVNEGEMDNTRLDWRIEKGGQRYVRVGKARAGRLLDGVEHNGMPEANHG